MPRRAEGNLVQGVTGYVRYSANVVSRGYTDIETDIELAAMLGGIESDLVERKESPSDTEKIRRCICAFANDLPAHGKPGIIAVGITDDGQGAGLHVDDDLLKRLADMRGDGLTLPIPSMDVQRRSFDDCDIAVVTVQPATDPPVRYKGRVWVRVGPTVRLASAAEDRKSVV